METNTREIPRERWQRYFDEVGKHFRGWLVTVDVLGRELGNQRLVGPVPLFGISFEPRGSESGDILIEAGDGTDALVIHHVDRPRSVRVAATQLGVREDIEIESDDGTTALLSLQLAAELSPGEQKSTVDHVWPGAH